MARNHTILDGLVYLEICNLLPDQRENLLVHSILKFMEAKFDFPMKFGNSIYLSYWKQYLIQSRLNHNDSAL